MLFEKGDKTVEKREWRAARAAELARAGVPTSAIAARLGVSARTVRRMLARSGPGAEGKGDAR